MIKVLSKKLVKIPTLVLFNHTIKLKKREHKVSRFFDNLDFFVFFLL